MIIEYYYEIGRGVKRVHFEGRSTPHFPIKCKLPECSVPGDIPRAQKGVKWNVPRFAEGGGGALGSGDRKPPGPTLPGSYENCYPSPQFGASGDLMATPKGLPKPFTAPCTSGALACAPPQEE